MNRRDFLHSSTALAALSLAGCNRKPVTTSAAATAPTLPYYDRVPALAPIRAHEDRIFRITVCLRPFRATGPRIELEKVADKSIIHNYGHGGSGWSLSWGSSTIAVDKALAAFASTANAGAPSPEIAVIGCGALGITSATLLQRAGARVTIYAKERPPFVRSSRATGSWTPDSRVAFASAAPATFPAQWEQMARTSWSMYQSFLGMPGTPIEYIDTYGLSDLDATEALRRREHLTPTPTGNPAQPELDFIRLQSRIPDLLPNPIDLPPGTHPFPTRHARRATTLMFNVADYSRQLVTDFLIAGGKIETAEFHNPSEVSTIKQQVIINCTGYGARQLWSDNSITPVRGQIAWLIPQPEVNYGLNFGSLNVLSRRDGIVVQPSPQGEATGWNDDNEQPNRQEAEEGVRQLATLMNRMAPSPAPPRTS